MSTEPTPPTLLEAIRHFSDPDTCLDAMVRLRWPDGVTCPTCGSKEVRFIATRRVWQCKNKHSRKQFSVKVGTIFEDSPIGLDKWFAAIWMIANCKNGISSYEVHRALGVTQKTAWFMLHRIRLAMQTGTFEKMSGQVEADETYIGGLARFMHKHKRKEKIKGTGGAGKTIVMGLLERGDRTKKSKVKTNVVPNTLKDTIQKEVKDNVELGSELFTDTAGAYSGIEKDFVHQAIDHAEAYVKGRVHTNGMENFWSLLKRTIKGTYVSVEPFHLFRYLDEQSFRFNSRAGTDPTRFLATLESVTGRRLKYKQLTGKDTATASEV